MKTKNPLLELAKELLRECEACAKVDHLCLDHNTFATKARAAIQQAEAEAAAPELLAALEAIIEDIETADEEESCRVVGSEKYHAGLEAIAKAKGKHNAQ